MKIIKTLFAKKKLTLLLVLFVFLCGSQVFAQPPDPPGDGGPPPTPIKGLIALALVVGAYFGAKKKAPFNSPKGEK